MTHNTKAYTTWLSSFCRWRNGFTERLSELLKVTHLVKVGNGRSKS